MRLNALAAFLPLCFLLPFNAGCDRQHASTTPLKPAAILNGEVIAEQEVLAEVDKLGIKNADYRQTIANQVLKSLIDRQLLVGLAEQSKLAEKPEVKAQLALARNKILAEAEIEVLTAGLGKPADQAVADYYSGHPELFAQRRIYQFQELLIDTKPENIEQVKSRIGAAINLPELARGLSAEGIAMRGRQVTKSAEDLPADMLTKLNGMGKGQSLILAAGDKLNVIILSGFEESPITLEQARPAIERYLVNSKKREKVEVELDKLRKTARIEYQSPYAAPSKPAN